MDNKEDAKNDNAEDDFKLDLDGTCAAAFKRYTDTKKLILASLDEVLEPINEHAKACNGDAEAFWVIMTNEYKCSCACDVIRLVAKEVERRNISHKDLIFTTCFGIIKGRASEAMAMQILKETLDKLSEDE